MERDVSGVMRETMVTIAISAAAMVMCIILVVLNGLQGKVSWVGIIVTIAMFINIIMAAKRRKEAKEYINRNPRL